MAKFLNGKHLRLKVGPRVLAEKPMTRATQGPRPKEVKRGKVRK